MNQKTYTLDEAQKKGSKIVEFHTKKLQQDLHTKQKNKKQDFLYV